MAEEEVDKVLHTTTATFNVLRKYQVFESDDIDEVNEILDWAAESGELYTKNADPSDPINWHVYLVPAGPFTFVVYHEWIPTVGDDVIIVYCAKDPQRILHLLSRYLYVTVGRTV